MLLFQGRGVSLKVKCMHPPEVTFLSTKHSIVALENDTQDFMDKLENFCDVCPKVCDVLEAWGWIVFFAYPRDRSAMLHCAPGSKILWLHQNASILSFGAWPNYPAFLVKMINELKLDLDTAKINIKVYFIQESVFCFSLALIM